MSDTTLFPEVLEMPAVDEQPTVTVKATGPKTTEYKLPDGVVLQVIRPTNRVRRVLVESPDQQVKFMLDTIAANCIVSMSIPADYTGEGEDAQSFEFNPKDIKAAHYSRLDDLSLLDTQSFSASFEEQNSPTKAIVEEITGAIAKARAAKK